MVPVGIGMALKGYILLLGLQPLSTSDFTGLRLVDSENEIELYEWILDLDSTTVWTSEKPVSTVSFPTKQCFRGRA